MGSTRAPACGLRRLVANVGEGKMFDARARRTAREARALPFELIPKTASRTFVIAGFGSRPEQVQFGRRAIRAIKVFRTPSFRDIASLLRTAFEAVGKRAGHGKIHRGDCRNEVFPVCGRRRPRRHTMFSMSKVQPCSLALISLSGLTRLNLGRDFMQSPFRRSQQALTA